MKNNKTFINIAIAFILLGAVIVPGSVEAQSGTKRVELQRHDLSTPGREVLQSVVYVAPGETFPRHNHPGEEVIYVLEGVFEYQLDGKPPVTLKAGESLFIPAGTIHSAKNVGTGTAAELATHIVDKRKPLLTIVK